MALSHYDEKILKLFLDMSGVSYDDYSVNFYKAVHKKEDHYCASYDPLFIYEIGKTYEEDIDTDTSKSCGKGLHVGTPLFVAEYGRGWPDVAFLEVRVENNHLVIPDRYREGKFRTSQLTVLREVPASELIVKIRKVANEQKAEIDKYVDKLSKDLGCKTNSRRC